MRLNLGITWKLFLAVVAISIIIVLAMGGAVGIGLRGDFYEYAMELETRRTRLLLEELSDAYRDNGSWTFLQTDPLRWDQLVSLQNRDSDRDRDRDRDRDNGFDDGFDGDRDGDRDGRRDRRNDDDDDDDDWGRRHPDMTGLTSRIALFDAGRTFVAGNPDVPADAVRHPVVTDGQTVGWLAVPPFQGAIDAVDQQFQDRQLWTARIIGGASILLAGVIAWLIARVFLFRVQRIARATHQLAAGDYGTRIALKSGDELGALAEDFNILARTLEKNDQMRRSFTADVAHELRTPLAVLQAELAAVEDGVRQLSPATVKSLQAEIDTLSKLIDDLYQLSLSDMGALSYRKEDTDVVDVLRTVLDAFGQRLAQSNLTLELALPESPSIVHADPHWLTRLFNNLLDNSLRYTEPGGKLKVSCAPHNGHVRIDFEDTAPGVPDDALPRLFERLYRVEPSRSRAFGGAGLGLAICKNIVEAHDGTITAQHSPLGGLWITVILPLARS